MDEEFAEPRLAAIYDVLDPDRSDLDPYLGAINRFGAAPVLDIGCGTGTLALLLARQGCRVTAVDPAAASLAVARVKPGADRVRWVCGRVTDLPADIGPFAVATATANVAQFVVDPAQWAATLRAVRRHLEPDGRFLFETRDPAARGWEHWTRNESRRRTALPDGSDVESFVEVVAVDWPVVRIRWTFAFSSDGAVLVSESVLRFRERAEVEADLADAGFAVVDVVDPPDRPGREFLFVAAPAGR